MPGPEGIGARRIDLVDPSELVETVDLTEELDCDATGELNALEASSDPDLARQLDVIPAFAAPPALLGQRYQVEQRLGRGGTAVVVRALDLQHDGSREGGPEVAIKALRPEFRDRPHCIARLQREFRQTRSLVHPNIVRHHELGFDRGIWYIVMELLTGDGLGERLRRRSGAILPVHEILRIAAACGEALAFAHDRGVTHGDIKPGNVFLAASGEVRVLDFGVAPDALPVPPGSQPRGRVVPAATRAYASPQVLAGEAPEPRDDVFSLACLICEMLVGRRPPQGLVGADDRLARPSIEPLRCLTSQQWAVLAAAMAWRREHRPRGIRELMQPLLADMAPAPSPVRPPPRRAPIAVASRSSREPAARIWRDAGVVAGAMALGAIVGTVGWDSAGGQPPAADAVPLPAAGPVLPARVTAAAALPVPDSAAAAVPDGLAARPTPLVHVSFGAEAMTVSSGAATAAIPIRRDGHLARGGSVAWRVLDGTAVAGRDYGGLRSGVARFIEGTSSRVIYVPVMRDAGAAADRSFTVELSQASRGMRLGPVRRMSVTLEGSG